MATILEFRGERRQGGQSTGSTAARLPAGDIVFFPGVRYERLEDQPAALAKGIHRSDIDHDSN